MANVEAVVVPTVLTAHSVVVDVVDIACVVVLEVSCPAPTSVTHNAIMAPMNINVIIARNKPFCRLLLEPKLILAHLSLTSLLDF